MWLKNFMNEDLHLIIALGNIGSQYDKTRHNFGFLLLDEIIKDHKFTYQSGKFHSEIFVGEIAGKKIIAIKPQTFMNRSGIAGAGVVGFFKIDLKNIIVLHDDIDLEFGKVKIKIGGGNAGHNGLKSLDEHIGKNYTRLRLGVGRPEDLRHNVADYVLGDFSKEELVYVNQINAKISSLFFHLIEKKSDKFLNGFYLDKKSSI